MVLNSRTQFVGKLAGDKRRPVLLNLDTSDIYRGSVGRP
jgi:hypothetical protein